MRMQDAKGAVAEAGIQMNMPSLSHYLQNDEEAHKKYHYTSYVH